jgi:DNA adenine methylase
MQELSMKTIINYHLRERISPLDLIDSLFPKTFDRFIDPFCGSGNVWMHGSFKECVLSDLSQRFIDVLESVQKDCSGLVNALDEHKAKYGWKYFGGIKKKPYVEDRTQRAANLIFLNKASHQEYFRFNGAGLFLGAWGDHQFCPPLYDLDDLHRAQVKLENTHLNVSDFESPIDATKEGDFLYLHPPAKLENATWKQDFTNADYERLAASLIRADKRGVKFFILVSKAFWVNNLFMKLKFKHTPVSPTEEGYYNY